MKTATRLLIAAALALPMTTGMVACKKDEAPVKAEKPPVPVPTSTQMRDWHPYIQDVAGRNMQGVSGNVYTYILPLDTVEDYQGQFDRSLEKLDLDVQRGITSGNMLNFASPSPAKAADLAVEGFKNAKPGSLKGVKVLFIGKPEDQQRVSDAVAPSGATFAFHEMK